MTVSVERNGIKYYYIVVPLNIDDYKQMESKAITYNGL